MHPAHSNPREMSSSQSGRVGRRGPRPSRRTLGQAARVLLTSRSGTADDDTHSAAASADGSVAESLASQGRALSLNQALTIGSGQSEITRLRRSLAMAMAESASLSSQVGFLLNGIGEALEHDDIAQIRLVLLQWCRTERKRWVRDFQREAHWISSERGAEQIQQTAVCPPTAGGVSA